MSTITPTPMMSVSTQLENPQITSTATSTPITSVSTPKRNPEIQKGFNLLGLKVSDIELNELQHGNIISLEDRRLSEIGSVLILAEALSSLHSVKNITFKDLPEVVTESLTCSGIPVHRWNCDMLGKCYLMLTLVDGKPAFKISSHK
ncbi:hypothetical protein H6G54_14880 [Anabaena cylindrica FACHB-243]|uniref:Uncharacterized protein n=1 Tax=Anabaena cylindrica (strain ATCC 27899 / PCC 7122) TaxID=272123 RepID=K9ZEP4_ANACC|nr:MULTISPECIES: hypothetical protein [Anabaena]AFZ56830.1 hypothetical protein Anacy_1302 [Anabaena cylindrica PCC 7122]MBD2418960.1 hypothetical protein [Anabaena cylindrica FACHB-243]MBY5285102.1 hypothetical protein [Anabaena sp. CCAP 1446/1C]MBY5308834.1 hypothetical protein [Anabaena sp. CCAP 1446/1C]MCM2409507.1 hypothetical protein [Anabaena sp. CCAP 1446/1C]